MDETNHTPCQRFCDCTVAQVTAVQCALFLPIKIAADNPAIGGKICACVREFGLDCGVDLVGGLGLKMG